MSALAARGPRRDAVEKVRALFFVYCALLLVEGGLRKWVLPGLSTPLLLVRDPVALAAIVIYLMQGWRVWHGFAAVFAACAVGAMVTTMTIGHQNPLVALFGMRIYLVHIPAIFCFAKVLDREDVLRLVRVALAVALPLMLLNVAQLYAPQSAWINRGVGDDLSGSGFGGQRGYSRVAGVFSFTTGNVSFFCFVAASAFAAWFNDLRDDKLLRLCASAAVLIGLGVLISRSYVFMCVLLTVSIALPLAAAPRLLGRVGVAAVFLALLGAALIQFEGIQFAYDLTTERFETSARSEGDFLENSVGERVFGSFYRAFVGYEGRPFWGHGLGYTSNVGSKLLSGKVGFLGSEDEWSKHFEEFGVLLAVPVVLTRAAMTVWVLWGAVGAFRRERRTDAYFFAICAATYILQGNTQQATNLGFLVVFTVVALVLSRARPAGAAAPPRRLRPVRERPQVPLS